MKYIFQSFYILIEYYMFVINNKTKASLKDQTDTAFSSFLYRNDKEKDPHKEAEGWPYKVI